MESDDELPQDYYDLTPEHYAKMTVSKVICNRSTSKEKDSCEYLVHYVKADKSVCEKIYPQTAMDHMCNRASAAFRQQPENSHLISLLISYAMAHMNLESQIEEARREVHDAWDALGGARKKLREEAGGDPIKYLFSPAGTALANTLHLCEERLVRAQDCFVGLLGFFRPSLGQGTAEERRSEKYSATPVEKVTTTKAPTIALGNESQEPKLLNNAYRNDHFDLIFQCSLCDYIAQDEREALSHSSVHKKCKNWI